MTRNIILRNERGQFTAVYQLPSARALVLFATGSAALYYFGKTLFKKVSINEQTKTESEPETTKNHDNFTTESDTDFKTSAKR